MAKGVMILSDYDGLPEKSKKQAEKLLERILEKEREEPEYRIRFSPKLNDHCRRGYRGLNYVKIFKIARSGKIVGKEPPTDETREWRYLLQGLSAGQKRMERFELVFSFENEKTVVFITCYPKKKKGAKR